MERTFLIVTWQAGGGIQPALGLGRLLSARGHAVQILAPEVHRKQVEAAGCAWIRVSSGGRVRSGGRTGGGRTTGLHRGDVLRRRPARRIDGSGAMPAAGRARRRCAARLDAVDGAGTRAPGGCARAHVALVPRRRRQLRQLGTAAGQRAPRPPRSGSARRRRGHRLRGVATALGARARRDARGVRRSRRRRSERRAHGLDFRAAERRPQAALGRGGPDAARRRRASSTYMHQEWLLERILSTLAELPVHVLATTGPELDPNELRVPASVELRDYVPHASCCRAPRWW